MSKLRTVTVGYEDGTLTLTGYYSPSYSGTRETPPRHRPCGCRDWNGHEMTADELRELAERLTRHDETVTTVRQRAADYLRACADALDAGPVAWVHTEYGNNEYYGAEDESAAVECPSCPACTPLYPLAMPAQAQPLRLPEPLTDEDVDALIDETEYLPTDHAVRYLVETGECRVKEVNE